MNDKIIKFEDYQPHLIQEVICLKCLHRCISVRPEGTLLKKLECLCCGQIGYTIATGEWIDG
jgi:hypothetical protein